jgi:hypothetical protein
MEGLLSSHRHEARSVSSIEGFKRLKDFYPPSMLKEEAKVVVMPPHQGVPRLPLAALGVRGFEEFEDMEAGGITFKDTYFVLHASAGEESLHFHELVHVVQWKVLGVDDFIRCYALGHIVGGSYRNNPLEDMAYHLQQKFEEGSLPPGFDTPQWITSALHSQVLPLLPPHM